MRSREEIAGVGVSVEAAQALLPVLERVREGCHARAVLLIDREGRSIVEAGEMSNLDIAALGPLAASSVVATSSLSKILGEREFTLLFHQGEKDSIHFSLLEEGLILAVFFGRGASLGLVRLRLRKASNEMREILRPLEAGANRPVWWASDSRDEITAQDIEDLFTL